MRERDIEDHLAAAAEKHGALVRKVQWIGRRGCPDRVLFFPARRLPGGATLPARTLWVEVKAPGGKPEPYQLREHARMRAAGADVVVVDSVEAVDLLF